MQNEKGFTLVEMLIILMMIMILTILIVPNMFKMIEEHEINAFFKQLEADILYIQSETMSQAKEYQIYFYSDQEEYKIINFENKKIKEVKVPKKIRYSNVQNIIKFNIRGNVMNPRTFYFWSDEKTYKLVLPFGKGRHYIEKE